MQCPNCESSKYGSDMLHFANHWCTRDGERLLPSDVILVDDGEPTFQKPRGEESRWVGRRA